MGEVTLKTFVLDGDSRAVDVWFAENGMGWEREIDGGGWLRDDFESVCRVDDDGLPSYCSDDTTATKINDRINDVDLIEEYTISLRRIVGSHLLEPPFKVIWDCLNATNRQHILAAAKAMGLKL